MPDYLLLRKKKGIGLSEYVDYRLFDSNNELRETFLGLREQVKFLGILNPRKYYSVARNKYFTHLFLEQAGIRTAGLFCYFNPQYCIEGHERIASNTADVMRILKGKGVESCVIKSTEDSHGEGVVVVDKITYADDDCIFEKPNGGIVRLSQLSKGVEYIFESKIKQTEQFSKFNPSSVNCVRFMTALYPDGTAKVLATFVKIGRKGKSVDNAGGGGNVDAKIDVNSGRICNALEYKSMQDITSVESHPDSGEQLNGVVVDNWESIKQYLVKCQQAMPYVKAAGWDIAITDDGPVVVEVNDFWDRTGQLFNGRGWRDEIKVCYEAWVKHNKKFIV